jgi:hypothetical protein
VGPPFVCNGLSSTLSSGAASLCSILVRLGVFFRLIRAVMLFPLLMLFLGLLERQNRRVKRAGALAFAVVGTLVLMGEFVTRVFPLWMGERERKGEKVSPLPTPYSQIDSPCNAPKSHGERRLAMRKLLMAWFNFVPRFVLTPVLAAFAVLLFSTAVRADTIIFNNLPANGNARCLGLVCGNSGAAAKFIPDANYTLAQISFVLSGGGTDPGLTIEMLNDSGIVTVSDAPTLSDFVMVPVTGVGQPSFTRLPQPGHETKFDFGQANAAAKFCGSGNMDLAAGSWIWCGNGNGTFGSSGEMIFNGGTILSAADLTNSGALSIIGEIYISPRGGVGVQFQIPASHSKLPGLMDLWQSGTLTATGTWIFWMWIILSPLETSTYGQGMVRVILGLWSISRWSRELA